MFPSLPAVDYRPLRAHRGHGFLGRVCFVNQPLVAEAPSGRPTLGCSGGSPQDLPVSTDSPIGAGPDVAAVK
jgi:hypothetical protein